jgi:hypothetical protein
MNCGAVISQDNNEMNARRNWCCGARVSEGLGMAVEV